MLGIFWVVLYALQIGFCLILVLARKEETKVRRGRAGMACRELTRSEQETLTHGIGMRFAIANWLMAAWAVAWVSAALPA